MMGEEDRKAGEIRRLLSIVLERTGMDFRDYARSSLARRILRRVSQEGVESISALGELVSRDPRSMDRLLSALTIPVTAMFRDPTFFAVLRERVVPVLRTFPFLRLWVAGCSTGEEVFSLAILLHEEGLYPRCRIYATDLNEAALARARAGIYPLSSMQANTRNYHQAGGASAFADYYTADSENVVFRPFLRDNVVFAAHNLATDVSFNEFHVVLCRNVMIYFNRRLRDRAQRVFHESLVRFGHLGLGRSESMRFSPLEPCYHTVSIRERIYRRVR